MSSHLNKAEKQLNGVEADIGRVEEMFQATPSDPKCVLSMLSEASAGLATASLTLRSANEIISRETSMDKRKTSKQRLKELRIVYETLKDKLDGFKSRVRESERINARTHLLSNVAAGRSNNIQITKDMMVDQEDRTFGYAANKISDYISLGTNTLDTLRSQQSMLKSAQRRVLDAGTRLGLSQSVMRIIARRTAQDRYIFYGGLSAAFIVIYLCWKYLI